MTEPAPLADAAPLDRVRARILGDPVTQMRLAQLYDSTLFVSAVMEIAVTLGVTLTEDIVHAAMRTDPLGLDRFVVKPITGRDAPGADWLPIAVASDGNELAVDWAHFAGARLTAPFYEDSLRRARALPLNRLVRQRTPLAGLARAGEDMRPPDGFIFHLSRCGSTLVSQMLAADPHVVMVSEAPPIDSIVQLVESHPDVPIEERAHVLRAMVAALGRNRAAHHYVVKLDSWHALALPLFRLAFPDTPWIFLYRDPVEILVSQMRQRGVQTVPGTIRFDPYRIDGAEEMSGEEYCARTLDRVCTAVLDNIASGGGLIINYTDLPGAVDDLILPHFGITPDAKARAAMAAATRFDAKTPTEAFTGDSEAKQREAGAAVRSAAALADQSYRRLESLRTATVE